MTVADILLQAREMWGALQTNPITDAMLLKWLQEPYHELENAIVTEVNEDYFFDILRTNLIADQNEYTLQPSTAVSTGVKKIISVEVKRNTNDSYRSLPPMQKDYDQDAALDQLEVETQLPGFYDIKDSSIFLYPKPTATIMWGSTITNGLQMQAIVNMIDLTLAGVEADIYPWHTELRQYHHLLPIWLAHKIYIYKKMWTEAREVRALFLEQKQIMIDNLSDRDIGPIEVQRPDLSYYKN